MISPRSLAALFILLTLHLLTTAQPARAGGDCPGMSDYTYESGSCSSNTGDFYSVLQKSDDQEYELGIARIRRMQAGSSGGGGGTAMHAAVHSNAQAVRRLFYTPQAEQLYPSWYARQAYPHDPRSRASLERSFHLLLKNYRASAQQYGYTLNFVPDAALLYIAAAYQAFDGERFSDAASKNVARLFIMRSLARNPNYLSLNDTARQLISERYVVSAQLMTLLYANEEKRRDTKGLRVLRETAHGILRKQLGMDPAQVKEDQLVCLSPHALSCASYLKLMRASAGGAQLTQADMVRMVSPFAGR